MAFIKTPDGISIELLQAGQPLDPQEPGFRWKIQELVKNIFLFEQIL